MFVHACPEDQFELVDVGHNYPKSTTPAEASIKPGNPGVVTKPYFFKARNFAGFVILKEGIHILFVHSHEVLQTPGLAHSGYPFGQVR
jgi:hypothetical protein